MKKDWQIASATLSNRRKTVVGERSRTEKGDVEIEN